MQCCIPFHYALGACRLIHTAVAKPAAWYFTPKATQKNWISSWTLRRPLKRQSAVMQISSKPIKSKARSCRRCRCRCFRCCFSCGWYAATIFLITNYYFPSSFLPSSSAVLFPFSIPTSFTCFPHNQCDRPPAWRKDFIRKYSLFHFFLNFPRH